MSSKISQNSMLSIPSFIAGDIDVLIKFKGKTYALDEVTNYESLCQEIEENLKGVKVQDLDITYEAANGKVLTVQSEKNFIAVCKRAKQQVQNPDDTLELCLTCTLVALEMPVPIYSQQVNQGLKGIESFESTQPSVSHQNPQGFQYSVSLQRQTPMINPTFQRPQITEPLQIPPTENQSNAGVISAFGNEMKPSFQGSNITEPLKIPPPVNQYHPQKPSAFNTFQDFSHLQQQHFVAPNEFQNQVNRGIQFDQNIHKNVNVSQSDQQNQTALGQKGQDAARCACGDYLDHSQPKSGICPNQECILHTNQNSTLLWSCSYQKISCGRYCWMCVQTLLRNCKEYVFQDVNIKNKIDTIRQSQLQNCQAPTYNPQKWVPTPTSTPPIFVPQEQKLNPEELFKDQPKTSIASEQKILGLDQNDLKEIERETVAYFKVAQTLEDWFLDTICEQYKLDEKRPELIEFCEKFSPKQASIEWPILPEIKAYQTKKRIIEFILKNEQMPTIITQKKEFEGLNKDKLGQFKESYNKLQAISFLEDQLFKEETQLVSKLFIENKSFEEISQITLIQIDLVEKLCNLKENILKKETELLDLIRKRSSCQTDEEVIQIIIKDDQELFKVLIEIYNDSKEEYLQITQKLKDKNFAINFESSQELAQAFEQINKKSQLPIPSEEKILGLDQNDLEEIEREAVAFFKDAQTLEDWLIDALCEQYKLDEKRSELIEFCNKFSPKQVEIIWPILPEIKAYQTKKRIIEFILKNEQLPTITTLKKEFEGLNKEKLGEFKKSYQNFNAISFIEEQLFKEELELVSKLQTEKKSKEEISNITLIHTTLVTKLYDFKVINIKKEPALLDLISNFSSCQTNEEVIELIINDDEELVKVLIQAYKENKEKYLEITTKLRDGNFAINYQSSQEVISLEAQIQKEASEAQDRLLKESQIPIQRLILDLDLITLEELKNEVMQQMEESENLEEKFIDHLCNEYNLQDKRQELLDYCETLSSKKKERPTLTKINNYQTKKRIIDFLVSNEKMPTKFKLKEEFEGLTIDQLNEFKICNQNYKAISFTENDLLEKEIEIVRQLQKEKRSNEEISKITLIDFDLVKKFYDLKVNNLKKETALLDLIRKRTSFQTNEQVVQLIIDDDDELVRVLLKIYKEKKEEYLEITRKLKNQDYAINFEQSHLQNLIRLSKQPDLGQKIDLQKEVLLLLDNFYNKDLEVYLMVLHDFTDIGQSVDNKYDEKIILKQQHKDIRKAVAQLLLIEMDPDKKNQVIQTKLFMDDRESAMLKQLEGEITQYMDKKIQQNQQIEKPQNQGTIGKIINSVFGQQKKQIEGPCEEETFYKDEQPVQVNKLEMVENDELVNMIQAICNITSMKIKIHSKSDLTLFKEYKPESQEGEGTLNLVRDDLNKAFFVMIQFKNENKIISYEGLQDLKTKYTYLSQSIPSWLEIFIQLPSLRIFLNDSQDESKRMLEEFSAAQMEFLRNRDEANKIKLYDAVIKLDIDSQIMQEWFSHYTKVDCMVEVCNFLTNKSTRQNPQRANTQVDKIQKYFPMNPRSKTLEDFNRVQTYKDPDARKKDIERLKSQPEQLTQFYINTHFGVILRKDDMTKIQSELAKILEEPTISLRFLISFLLQTSDFGLRARLDNYLCQYKSVPLIMNCQEKFKIDQNYKIYNQELVFSMSDVEGVGVLAFGVGKNAINPCGKSEISNLIVTPLFDNKSFDVQDLNVFSNGQIDVFFEKCYQEKNGWAFMDGQGKISEQSLLSVLPLTNIVFIHFMEKDQNDETSVAELVETIQLIKQSDPNIQVCLILRDCTETKEVNKSQYPVWLTCKDKVNKLIQLINIQNETRLEQKSNFIEKIILYFNEKVREIRQNKSKFTKKNFLNGFCVKDIYGEHTHKRISEILKLSEEFFKEVQVSKDNVFSQQGLPSLQIKDQIREISVKLRSFEFLTGEDQESAIKREKEMNNEQNQLIDQLSKLEVNPVMKKFWNIVIHNDAVQIKIEVSKSLAKFTQDNIKKQIEDKNNFIDKKKATQSNNNGGIRTDEEIQQANDEYKQQMKEFEDEIFKRSQSLEYHQRNLNCVMLNSKQCDYWSKDMNKQQFKKAVKQQMLDGDTFELVDGRNLEMKADIIREIVGSEIDLDHTKCIVVCVIGPQSTGKSTLMNFCFGTQFLASTGRCTQGIYFTLQKIPREMKGSSDVEYLIILDTEGLNSPERAEGDKNESEYDRKIVLFTLLCSDFLIINSSGDMSLQMKELIKICAVRYDELRAYSKAPRILYTFVKNGDNNPAKFKEQIQSLRTDVIESSNEKTIEMTADELMQINNDSVKVLGSAYDQKLIEKDSEKGILDSNYINVSAPLFGVHASQVWKQVQNFIESGQHQFRQMGKWLLEAEEHWSLIDRHGAKLTQFGNVLQMKNDKKIKTFINQLWQSYISTQITSKDNQKAMEKCQELYEKERDREDIKPLKQKFIEENNKEKDNDFQNYILSQYTRWTKEHSQRNFTVGAEQEYIKDCKIKMNRLKEDYELLIENKLKELRMTQIHTSGISDVYRRARKLCQDIKKMAEVDQDAEIKKEFGVGWGELEKEISSESQIEQMRKTNSGYLCRTFMSVNKYMLDILPQQLDQILLASKTDEDEDEMHPNSTLPKKLVQYLVDHISRAAFQEKKKLDTLGQFKLEESQLGMLEVVEKRIFGLTSDAIKEKYLPLQKMLQVNYTYFVINDIETALFKSSVFQEIYNYLQLKMEDIWYEDRYDHYGRPHRIQIKAYKDDKMEIENKLTGLFQELGQAGFCIEEETKSKWGWNAQKELVPLDKLNVETMLKVEKIQNNDSNKRQLIQRLRHNMKWEEKQFKSISPRIQSLLGFNKVLIANQSQPNISLEQHKRTYPQRLQQKYIQPNPQLSYHFSEQDDGVKINVKRFLQERKIDYKQKNYEECLINPKQYEISDECKWIFLSELANAVVDWSQIVLDIEKNVLPQIHQINLKEQKNQNKEQDIMKFDLKSVLERSQINIETAELIQSSCLQPIKTYLNDEVRQKLSLHVNLKLSGVITWVACVIIWFNLQKNVITIFNREIEKIKDQKSIVFEKFLQIAKGQKTATTANCAEEIFSQTFKKFNEICLNEYNSFMIKYLESQEIKDKFDTVNVYKQLDETYIAQTDPKEYKSQINYVKQPLTVFTNYVGDLKKNLIECQQQKMIQSYKQKVLNNLQTLEERLQKVYETLRLQTDIKDDSINFFEVSKAGKKVDNNEEKEEIESQMSPILLETLRQILGGTYTVSQLIKTLNYNGENIEYCFTVKQKDLAKNFIGSPYNDLQKLVFDESKPDEYLKIFFERLDLCINSSVNGVCTDMSFMVNKLIQLVQAQVQEISALELDQVTQKFKAQDDIINTYRINAIGCTVLCKFCNRKCELASHQDDNENHNCNNRGHGLRVFGGGTLVTTWGESYPSLTTCDEIKHNTKIKIVKNGVSEVRLWSEEHNFSNTNWITKETKFQPDGNLNPEWLSINVKLEQFWKVHGPRYCKEMKYTFIEPKKNEVGLKASQMSGCSIVIICLDESNSMFNARQDFNNAVQGGKELEQFLKKNHSHPDQVQIQLWFNDCYGVNKVYAGQLSGQIPTNSWIRSGCQGDQELEKNTNVNFNYGMCGQFTGAVRILNQEVNNLLGSNPKYESVYWFFFTDGQNQYPKDELVQLQQTLSNNRARWTFQGNHKLIPMIITNQLTIASLCLMKKTIDEIMKEIWQVEDVCVLKQEVKTENLAATMIEQFTFSN